MEILHLMHPYQLNFHYCLVFMCLSFVQLKLSACWLTSQTRSTRKSSNSNFSEIEIKSQKLKFRRALFQLFFFCSLAGQKLSSWNFLLHTRAFNCLSSKKLFLFAPDSVDSVAEVYRTIKFRSGSVEFVSFASPDTLITADWHSFMMSFVYRLLFFSFISFTQSLRVWKWKIT